MGLQSDLKQISNHYGYTHQKNMLIEEMAELIQALNKLERYGRGSVFSRNVIEEIADVEIMLAQVKYLLNVEDEVNDIVVEKIKRQINRVELEKEQKWEK